MNNIQGVIFLDELSDIIGTGLKYIFDKIVSTNLRPLVIILFIVILFISYVNQYSKLKRTLKHFASGNFDKETIWRCEELKKAYWLPHTAEAHDAFCIRLSAIYMKQGNLEGFFTNINSIKKLTKTISNRMCMLLAAYFIGEDYLAVVELFQAQNPDKQNAVDFAAQIIHSKDQEPINTRIMSAKAQITNPEILKLLSTMTSKTGDGLREPF